MRYKTWCKSIVLAAVSIIGGLFIALYVIDPIGMFGSPLIAGVNNYKEKQDVFLDVYKPFELRRYQPDDIYIGTSRVYVGWEAEESAYNLGMSSLSLPDMRDYLHYVYGNHVPQRVYIGLDLFQFSKSSMEKEREGFSNERLNKLAKGDLYVIDEILSVSMGMRECIRPTLKASQAHRNDKPIFIRGFSTLRGEQTDINVKEYYHYLHSFYKTYSSWDYAPEAVICLQAILQEAEANGVEVYLFFNPVSVDLLALQDVCNVDDDYREIKRQIAQIHPVYDFAWTNDMTMDREQYWLDASHYHSMVGEMMKQSMKAGMNENICKLLSGDNVNTALSDEAAAYAAWRKSHLAYREALNQLAPKEMEPGQLQVYLGF